MAFFDDAGFIGELLDEELLVEPFEMLRRPLCLVADPFVLLPEELR